MVDISKALEIGGWMNREELSWLAEQASKHNYIVEVGCWMGRTTRALADNTSGYVFAVDTWLGSEENQEFLKDKTPDYLWQRFTTNLGDHLWTGKVNALRMPSVQAAAKLGSNAIKCGMIFIDGSHDYDSVHNDILAWRPLLVEGGLFCGHDYDLGWPGVVQAVRELIAPVPMQVGGSSLWYLET
jgi:hypothetical protein